MAHFPPSYVPDGYTEQGRVAPLEGFHSGAEFTFRPLTWEQKANVLSRWNDIGPAERIKRIRETIKRSVVSITLPGAPKDLAVDDHMLDHLAPLLSDRLFNIALRIEASDMEGVDAAPEPESGVNIFGEEVQPDAGN